MYKRQAFKGIKYCIIINFAMIAAMGIPVYYLAEFFVSIFTSDQAAVGFGVSMIHVMMPLYIFQSLNALFSGATRGFGKSRNVMLLSILGMVVCRQIFLAISMSIEHVVVNVYYGYPLGWACSAAFVYIYYYFNIKRR